jgi:thiamine biosynthesis lipoprotein
MKENRCQSIKKCFLLLLALAVALSAAGCAGNSSGSTSAATGEKKYEAEFLELFDTLTQIVGYADSQEQFAAVAAAIKEDLAVYHQLYDIYHSYPGLTNLRDINERAGQGPVQVDRRIIEMLQYSREMYDLTGGKVNVAMGAVLRIWHDYRTAAMDDPSSAAVPSADELQQAAAHTDIGALRIDAERSTIELLDPAMSLDVGAIAKGYATEQAVRLAAARGVRHLLLSVGGNVRAIGYRNDRSQNGEYLAILSIHDTSVVTSGVYERFYEFAGRRYHHIIDPDSLFPENRYLSVTVITEDSGLADALSTGLFNLDYEEGLALVKSLTGTEALWCFPDGSTRQSGGFAALLPP